MAKNKKVIEEEYGKICSEIALVFSEAQSRERIHERAQLNALSRLLVAPRTEYNSLQILPYFFYNFFSFSHWPLIFDTSIIKSLSIPIKSF